MQISVDFDMSEVTRWADRMGSVVDQARASALNKLIDQGRTQMVREISREFNLSSAAVRERLVVRRASAKAQRFILEVSLAVSGKKRSVNVIRYMEKSISLADARRRMRAGEGGVQTLRGGGQVSKALQLRFKFKRSGPKRMIEGAFIGNKGRTVFVRTGPERLPIEAVQTIDVPQMFNARRINAKVVEFIKARAQSQFERELSFFMSRAH